MSPQAHLFRTACFVAVLALLPATACSQERATASTESDEKTFSHDDLGTVLQRVVDDQGLVDYHALAEDRAALDRYLEQIHSIGPKNHPELFPTKDDELAYYINAYNALVLDKVLDKGPDRETVWGFTGTGYSFFVQDKVQVGGQTTNLKALEDDIIRGEFQDPRIHAAINCASISCPELPQKPFLPDSLSAQLDAAMKDFVAKESNARQEEDTVYLSKIFEWFRGDFVTFEEEQGVEDPSLVDYINRYRAPGQSLDRTLPITFLEYDKGLNRQP